MHLSPAPRVSPTVLLLTDDANLRGAAARVLLQEGYRVIVARHAGHAMLASLRSRIDALVTDLETGEGSGSMLAERLRRHHPGMQALYFAQPGSRCAAEDVLVKPFLRDDLLAHLGGILAMPRHAGLTTSAV